MILLALIIVGVAGLIVVLTLHAEQERFSKGIPLETVLVIFLVQSLLIMGVVYPLIWIFTKISPG